MSKFEHKKGSLLLVNGLDVSKPAEYIDDSACSFCQNVEVDEGLLKKRFGTIQYGGIVGSGTLTLTGNAGNTETVVIGTKTYTFQTTLTDVDGNVKIGTDASESIDNLIAAINKSSGAGTTYAASMTAQPEGVKAAAGAGDTMVIRVNADDTSDIATTETLANGSWGAAKMTFPTGLEIMTGREFSREGVSYNVRVGIDKTEVWDATNSEWDDITKPGTDWTGDTDDLFDIATPLLSGDEILCISNGKDAIQKWTGSGLCADLGGSPPVAKYIQEFKTYLVCANIQGGVDVAQRVKWSDTADPEEWSSGNAGAVDLVEDGEAISGLGLYGNYLCVHKPHSIYIGYLVSSDSIFQFDRRATGVGTIANNSIVNIPTGEQIFLAKDGIRIFNGITAPLIGSPINDEIRNSLNAEKAHKAYGILVLEKDEVWIGVPIGSQEYGETIYKYNYKSGALHKDTRSNASCMWRGDTTNSPSWDDYDDSVTWDDVDLRWNDISFSINSDQINIGYNTGLVDKVSTAHFTDNGSTITSQWDSKDFQHSQDVISRWKRIEIWTTGSSLNVYYSTDEGVTWTEISNSPFTLTNSMPQHTAPIIGYFDVVSSKIRFRFENTSTSSGLSIKQFIVGYVTRESRR